MAIVLQKAESDRCKAAFEEPCYYREIGIDIPAALAARGDKITTASWLDPSSHWVRSTRRYPYADAAFEAGQAIRCIARYACL